MLHCSLKHAQIMFNPEWHPLALCASTSNLSGVALLQLNPEDTQNPVYPATPSNSTQDIQHLLSQLSPEDTQNPVYPATPSNSTQDIHTCLAIFLPVLEGHDYNTTKNDVMLKSCLHYAHCAKLHKRTVLTLAS